jgi:NAD(P)-dependent dehydrogenase (short-subunit alcohol dehydrogenase family)
MVDQAVDTLGRLDVLVNNTGIVRDRMVFNLAEDMWDAVIRAHLKGTFACQRTRRAHCLRTSSQRRTKSSGSSASTFVPLELRAHSERQ